MTALEEARLVIYVKAMKDYNEGLPIDLASIDWGDFAHLFKKRCEELGSILEQGIEHSNPV